MDFLTTRILDSLLAAPPVDKKTGCHEFEDSGQGFWEEGGYGEKAYQFFLASCDSKFTGFRSNELE